MWPPMATSARLQSPITARPHPFTRPLPNGSCNYRSLDAGLEALTCGCQSFWPDDSSTGRHAESDNAKALCFCACGHHACFHQTASNQQVHSFPQDAVSNVLFSPSLAEQRQPFASGQQFQDGLQQTKLSLSALPSTAPPSVGSNKPPDSIDRCQASQLNTQVTLPWVMDYAHIPGALVGSPTEVNSPSVCGSPRTTPHIQVPRYNSVHTQPNVGAVPSGISDQANHEPGQRDSHQKVPVEDVFPYRHSTAMSYDLQNVMQSYARRLDVLENLSFSHVPLEEVQETLELLDERVLDLECWRADPDTQAQMTVDHGSQSASVGDEAGSMAEISTQHLADIEERLAVLEGAYPSYACPWDVDVVLLPWGRDLKGIWVDPPRTGTIERERCDRSLPATDLRASFNAGSSVLRPEESHVLPASWMPTWPVDEGNRLAPKAPGPNSAVFKRLRSRGLVRKVTLTESGASHIWDTIFGAFYSFLLQDAVHGNRDTSSLPEYLGLTQPLVPLRKVRRSPHLQFLAPHEMITPSTWDFDFLKSGIFMKTKGTYRLYITPSESYIQSTRGQWSWSWLRICGLPRTVGENECPGSATDEEECWDHHPTLDQLPSFDDSSRFSSQSDDGQDKENQSPRTHDREHVPVAAPSPAGSIAFDAVMTLRGRTPIATSPGHRTALSTKRSIDALSEDVVWYQKRRRRSSSLETERRVACLTPRWSREPRSPFTPACGYEPQSPSSPADAFGGPQFAYATPHSNNVAGLYADAGGDTEPEPDSDAGVGEGNPLSDSENEWEGMGDDRQDATSFVRDTSLDRQIHWEDYDANMADEAEADPDSEDSMVYFDEEDADEDLDDGVTIYEVTL